MERERKGVGRERDKEGMGRAKGREQEKSGREREELYTPGKQIQEAGKSLFYRKQKRKTSLEKQDKFFFFWFAIDQFEFFVHSHFLILPNRKTLKTFYKKKLFTKNVLRRKKWSLRLIFC